MIKAALFDYGGVLSPGGRKDSARGIIADYYGVELPWRELEAWHYRLRRGEIISDEFFQALSQIHHSDRVMSEEEWNARNAAVFNRSELVYGLAERLREVGIITGIISNIYEFEAREIERRGNYDRFDPLVLSSREGSLKPELPIFERALGRLAVSPSAVVLLDDQQKAMAPAAQLGMQAILVVSPEQAVYDMTELMRDQNGIEL